MKMGIPAKTVGMYMTNLEFVFDKAKTQKKTGVVTVI